MSNKTFEERKAELEKKYPGIKVIDKTNEGWQEWANKAKEASE